jgi:ethanolamine utilization protein EutN
MNIGRVVGTVVSTRKDDTLVGSKLLIVYAVDINLRPGGTPRVMVDTVGAGIGELVLYVSGAAARNAVRNKDCALDTAIVGIIDEIHVSDVWKACDPVSTEGDEQFE